MDVVFLVEHARGDGARRHARRHTTREARKQQRHGKDGRACRTQNGGERGRCDGEVVYDNAVRVEELVAQTLLDNLLALAFEVHGLDDLGVQEEVVGHNDRA